MKTSLKIASAVAGVGAAIFAGTAQVIPIAAVLNCVPSSVVSVPSAVEYAVRVYDTPSGNLDAGYYDVATGQLGAGTASSTGLTAAHAIGTNYFARCDTGTGIKTVSITPEDFAAFNAYHDPAVKDSWKPQQTTMQTVAQMI